MTKATEKRVAILRRQNQDDPATLGPAWMLGAETDIGQWFSEWVAENGRPDEAYSLVMLDHLKWLTVQIETTVVEAQG